MGRKARGKSVTGVWLVGLLACVGVAVVAYYILSGPEGVRPSTKPTVSSPRVEVTEGQKLTLYLPKETPDGFVLAPSSRPFEGAGGKMDASVRALLATSQEAGLVGNLIPQGTRLLGAVRLKEDIAEVNLSKEFVENFTGGSDQEALTLNAVVATVVSNSGGRAKKVLIRVNGAAVESLGGHFDISIPRSPDPQLVKSENGS